MVRLLLGESGQSKVQAASTTQVAGKTGVAADFQDMLRTAVGALHSSG